jgi:hypothetical protein
VGPAKVVEVSPCPELEPGAGRLVTGTFSHHSGEVLDIAVDGLTEPIGCTGAHPFWSEDRQDFIPARELVPGETLRTESGTLRQITRITPRRGPPVPVFNLEVDAEHVYYVSVEGVLVHNACPSDAFDGLDDLDFKGQKTEGRKLGIDPADSFPNLHLNGNRLDTPGPHDVYVIRERRSGRLLKFGETGRGVFERFKEQQRKLKKPGIDIEVDLLQTVDGKAAAKQLEKRYIETYIKIFGQRPPFNSVNR